MIWDLVVGVGTPLLLSWVALGSTPRLGNGGDRVLVALGRSEVEESVYAKRSEESRPGMSSVGAPRFQSLLLFTFTPVLVLLISAHHLLRAHQHVVGASPLCPIACKFNCTLSTVRVLCVCVCDISVLKCECVMCVV